MAWFEQQEERSRKKRDGGAEEEEGGRNGFSGQEEEEVRIRLTTMLRNAWPDAGAAYLCSKKYAAAAYATRHIWANISGRNGKYVCCQGKRMFHFVTGTVNFRGGAYTVHYYATQCVA